MAGALAVVRAPAPGDDLAGADQDLPEFFLVGEPVQVPGAAGEGVVQDEELAAASGFLVGHGRGDDREVVGVAAVLLRHAGHQRRGERRDPLVHQGGGDREQDPDRLGVQHVGEDQLGVVAGSGAASLRAPEPVVAGLAVAGADQRVGVAGSGWLVRGRAAARDAGEELPDPGVLPGEPVGRLEVGPPDPQVEGADHRAPSEVHAERPVLVPPRTGLDVLGVDVHGERPLVELAVPVVAVVGDPRVVPPVVRGDPAGTQDLVQRAGVAELRVATARAGAGVLGGELLADVAALGADPPLLPQRAGRAGRCPGR